MQDASGKRLRAAFERREEHREIGRRDLATEPADARDEHELELSDDRPGDAHEEIVEAAVLEVVLDPRSADPPDATVDDRDLAVVDVPEPRKVPGRRAAPAERPSGHTGLHRANHADLDARRSEPVVEGARAALGIRALLVDHEPDRDAVPSLCDQRLGEDIPDRSRPEPELVDVDRRRGGPDVLEHPRVEGAALDEHVRRRGAALVELEREVGARHRSREQPLRMLRDALVGNGDRRPAGAHRVSIASPGTDPAA